MTLTKVLKTETERTEVMTAARQQRNFKGVVTQPTILELDNMSLTKIVLLKITFNLCILYLYTPIEL